jgi:hypothetical protein
LSRDTPKGASLLKYLEQLGAIFLKLQGLNPERGLAPGRLKSFQLKSFRPTLGVGPEGPRVSLGVIQLSAMRPNSGSQA